MAYRSQLANACADIEVARAAVAKAQQNYSDGGSVDAVNRANARLAEAHSRLRETTGGNVPDTR